VVCDGGKRNVLSAKIALTVMLMLHVGVVGWKFSQLSLLLICIGLFSK